MLRSEVDKVKLRAYLRTLEPSPSSASFSDMRELVKSYLALPQLAGGKPLGNLGFLALMVNLVVHCHADSFPLDIINYKTKNGDQIRSQETQPKKVFIDIGATVGFGSMAGRTNKTNLSYAIPFIDALNDFYIKRGIRPRFDYLLLIWIFRVLQFYARTPIDLTFDPKLALREFIRILLEALRKRDRDLGSGKKLAGLVLQHLVGAKLELAVEGTGVIIDHHPAFQSDAQYGRKGGL